MTRVILSHEDYERVLREGLDLEAYLQGRFDEAASDVKYLNEEVDVTIPINLEGERLGEALAKANEAYEVTSAKSQALHAQFTADRANDRLDELIKRLSYKLPDGTSVMIGDVLEFPENRVAKVTMFDEGTSLPIAIKWLEDNRTEWMTESEMMDAEKLPA